jgi:predicted RNA binding protein YcfA (HicA-like mRNA interferase family)
MPRRKRVTGKELIRALQRAQFQLVRVHGSHHRLRHADGRVTTVPVHSGETIGPGLLNQILQDCDLTHQQLNELL